MTWEAQAKGATPMLAKPLGPEELLEKVWGASSTMQIVKTKPVILLAEDSPDDQFLFRRTLNQLGIEVAIVTVSDGQAVIEYLKGEDLYADRIAYPIPTMLILDWSLPKMNGQAVLRQVKGHSDWQKIVVVILSGSLNPEVALQAKEMGAAAVMEKPPRAEQWRAIAAWLQ